MDPLIGASLTQLGGGILGSIFAPSASKKATVQLNYEKKLREWKAQQIAAALKPKTPYYTSGNLPQLGDTSMRAVMGNLASRLGPDMMAKWGINPAVPALAAPRAPVVGTGPNPGAVQPGYPQLDQSFPGQQMLLRRYGL